MINGQSFNKNERLCSKKEISELFAQGNKGFVYPFKFIYKKSDITGVKILISVPKRLFKHAVERNRIKRLTRESFRKNKLPLYDCNSMSAQGLHIAFIYIGKELLEYENINNSINKIISQITVKNKFNN